MDARIALSITNELVGAVDEWRRQEPDIPPRSEAIRRLVERGLVQERDGLWANCAEELYKILSGLHDEGAITDATMESANEIFGGTTGEAVASLRVSRATYGAPQPDFHGAIEKSLIEQVSRCQDLFAINKLWKSSANTIFSLGNENRALFHRACGLFALKKAELLTGEEAAFFEMLDPPGPSPREVEEQAEIDRRGGGGWIFHEGAEAGLIGDPVAPPYRLPLARELWFKGYIDGLGKRQTLSADDAADWLREYRKRRDQNVQRSPDLLPASDDPENPEELEGPSP
ncbi:hypothetical protein [Azospirillum lipoferum]|uniref:hypothetical protein n=1 Tax=Azospirillum lipoferum TaxID=193 RepID=UPI0013965E36|nr:hypothetical protein [Azospirillum lipoferum]